MRKEREGDQRRRSKKADEEEKELKEFDEGKEKGKCEAKVLQGNEK